MFVMDCYGHKLSNGVLFAHHLILDVPGGSSHLGYRRRVPPGHYPHMRVNIRFLPRTDYFLSNCYLISVRRALLADNVELDLRKVLLHFQ